MKETPPFCAQKKGQVFDVRESFFGAQNGGVSFIPAATGGAEFLASFRLLGWPSRMMRRILDSRMAIRIAGWTSIPHPDGEPARSSSGWPSVYPDIDRDIVLVFISPAGQQALQAHCCARQGGLRRTGGYAHANDVRSHAGRRDFWSRARLMQLRRVQLPMAMASCGTRARGHLAHPAAGPASR